eukprot:101165-Prorocentrum_lima.AAC.1
MERLLGDAERALDHLAQSGEDVVTDAVVHRALLELNRATIQLCHASHWAASPNSHGKGHPGLPDRASLDTVE